MGDFMPIIYINYNLYYYGGFRATNCLMTFVTHDTRDLPPLKKSKKSWGVIRRPQYQCCNFAVAFEMQRRMWASAQHSSSELGSAFALHHTCNVKEKVRRSSRETG